MPFTLYRDGSVQQTFILAQDLPVGGEQTLIYTAPEPTLASSYLFTLAMDDNGQGQKQTPLCSGSTDYRVTLAHTFLPLVNNNSSNGAPVANSYQGYLPYVSR